MTERITVIFKIIILLIFLATMAELHEDVHADNCDYAGGHSSRVNFITTLCSIDADNPLKAQIHLLDVVNEIVTMVFFPVMTFILIRWVEKE